jgi:hypothetical protein
MVISFLPYLSPKFPQTGERKKETKKGPAKTSPLHLEVSSMDVTPKSLTKRGKNGTMELIPIIAKNWQIHITYKFRFQLIIISLILS